MADAERSSSTGPLSDAYWLAVQDARVQELESALQAALEIADELCATADEYWDGRDGTAAQIIGAAVHEARERIAAMTPSEEAAA